MSNRFVPALIVFAGLIAGLVLVLGALDVFIIDEAAADRRPFEDISTAAEPAGKPLVPRDQAGLPGNTEQEASLLFFGDMMLDRHVGEKIRAYGFDYLFAKLATATKETWQNSYDLVSANLEGAVTDGGAHYPPAAAYDFAFAPEIIGRLKDYGFSAFNLANNHLADQGGRGIMETRANLSQLDYLFFGCQDRAVCPQASTTVRVHGQTIALAGYSMVYGVLDEEAMARQVKELASSSDSVLVNMHWGVEYEHAFNPKQRQVARLLIDSGADAVIGHHPHVVQGLEIYRKRPIFYSLGNFIFDQYFSSDTQEGLAAGLNWQEDGLEISLYPLKSEASQVRTMNNEERGVFWEKFKGWSELGDYTIDSDDKMFLYNPNSTNGNPNTTNVSIQTNN